MSILKSGLILALSIAVTLFFQMLLAQSIFSRLCSFFFFPSIRLIFIMFSTFFVFKNIFPLVHSFIQQWCFCYIRTNGIHRLSLRNYFCLIFDFLFNLFKKKLPMPDIHICMTLCSMKHCRLFSWFPFLYQYIFKLKLPSNNVT